MSKAHLIMIFNCVFIFKIYYLVILWYNLRIYILNMRIYMPFDAAAFYLQLGIKTDYEFFHYCIDLAHQVEAQIGQTDIETLSAETMINKYTDLLSVNMDLSGDSLGSLKTIYSGIEHWTPPLPGYTLYLTPNILQLPDGLNAGSVLMPQGLFQYKEERQGYVCILDANELKRLGFNDYLKKAAASSSYIRVTSLQKEHPENDASFCMLSSQELGKLDAAVLAKGGHYHAFNEDVYESTKQQCLWVLSAYTHVLSQQIVSKSIAACQQYLELLEQNFSEHNVSNFESFKQKEIAEKINFLNKLVQKLSDEQLDISEKINILHPSSIYGEEGVNDEFSHAWQFIEEAEQAITREQYRAVYMQYDNIIKKTPMDHLVKISLRDRVEHHLRQLQVPFAELSLVLPVQNKFLMQAKTAIDEEAKAQKGVEFLKNLCSEYIEYLYQRASDEGLVDEDLSILKKGSFWDMKESALLEIRDILEQPMTCIAQLNAVDDLLKSGHLHTIEQADDVGEWFLKGLQMILDAFLGNKIGFRVWTSKWRQINNDINADDNESTDKTQFNFF